MNETGATFERIYAAITQSPAYRAAANEQLPALPAWVVPFSTTSAEIAYHVASYPGAEDGTVLDLGCGTGGLTLWIGCLLGAKRIVGIDASPSAIAQAARLANELGHSHRSEFHVRPAERTGLSDASVALAMSFDALMFFDAKATVREVARVLQPGARFVCTTSEWTGPEKPPLATLERDYGKILEAAGFTIDTRDVLDRSRGLALYHGLLAREEALRAELGQVADLLLTEARDRVAEAPGTMSVRDRFYVARKLGSAPST